MIQIANSLAWEEKCPSKLNFITYLWQLKISPCDDMFTIFTGEQSFSPKNNLLYHSYYHCPVEKFFLQHPNEVAFWIFYSRHVTKGPIQEFQYHQHPPSPEKLKTIGLRLETNFKHWYPWDEAMYPNCTFNSLILIWTQLKSSLFYCSVGVNEP